MVRIKNNTLMIDLPDGSDARVIEEIMALVSKKLAKAQGEDILDVIERYHRVGKRQPFKRESVYHERTSIHRQ